MVHNLSVRTRLGGAFGVLMLVLVLISVLSLHALGESQARFAAFVGQTSARAALAADIERKVYDRAVAARNLVLVSEATDIAVERAAVTAAHEATTRDVAQLQAAVANPAVGTQEQQLVAAMAEVESRYGPVALDIVQKALAGEREAAILQMNTECRPLLAELMKAVGAYMAHITQLGAAEVSQAEEAYTTRWRFLVALCVLSCGAAALLAWWITRSLTRALGAEPTMLKAVAQRVAAGYLGEAADAPPVVQGSVMASLEDMRASLVGLVGQVRYASDAIASGSSQIAIGNGDLSQRTEEQAANLEQTAASMEQMHASVGHNAEKARLATELAGAASAAASRGGVVMGNVVSTMESISASARRITDIIGVIDGIAFQTNILALNAAVEAARAGEQGRGFAVVAGEVRSLARRSAEAAREIKALIGSSAERIGTGSRLVSDAGTAMEDIVAQAQRVAGLVEEIRASTAEQAGGIGEVNAAVSQLDRATQQNAALVEQSAAAAASLQRQAEALAEVVHKFRLEDARGPGAQTGARAGAPPVEVLDRQARQARRGPRPAVRLPAP